MYDFNIIVNEGTNHKEKHSFTLDGNGGVYKYKGSGKDYFLTMQECKLIVSVGGVVKLQRFLSTTNYRDTLKVAGLKVINCNP